MSCRHFLRAYYGVQFTALAARGELSALLALFETAKVCATTSAQSCGCVFEQDWLREATCRAKGEYQDHDRIKRRGREL